MAQGAEQCALDPACLRKFLDPSHQGARPAMQPGSRDRKTVGVVDRLNDVPDSVYAIAREGREKHNIGMG